MIYSIVDWTRKLLAKEKKVKREMSSKNISCYKWADLPKELVAIIGKHLESRIDVFRFRAVSTSWRSAVPPSYRQCQIFMSPPFKLPPPTIGTVVLSSVTVCRLEDKTRSSACLVKVVESSSGELQLLNPLVFFNPRMRRMPGNNSKTFNMLDLRLIEVARGYSFHFANCFRCFSIKKAVLFDTCGILAVYDSGKLRFCGFGDTKWTNLGKEGTHYDDVIVYKNQFYVIDSLGIISWIDKSMNLVQYSPPLCGLGHLKNLVESDGYLYVVDSYLEEDDEVAGQGAGAYSRSRHRVDMKVYKLDEEWGTWVNVKSLGDQVFVLGKDVCFSVCVRDFPGCLGNCIYFMDPKFELGEDARGPFVKDIVGSKSMLFVPRVFGFDDCSIKTVECFPGYSRLFSPSMNWPFSTTSSDLPHDTLM